MFLEATVLPQLLLVIICRRHKMFSPSCKWTTFLDDSLLDDPPQPFWCCLNEQSLLSADKDGEDNVKSGRKIRSHDGCSSGTSSKAHREKIRRNRLNNRFLELSALLEPKRPLKTDRRWILAEAFRTLSQLRMDAQQLRESNENLREKVKELRAEKNELRDAKSRLKSESEKLEQQLKCMSTPGYQPHPAALHAAAAAAFATENELLLAAANKGMSMASYSPSSPMGGAAAATAARGMWQWMLALDTSRDHVLRPPVA